MDHPWIILFSRFFQDLIAGLPGLPSVAWFHMILCTWTEVSCRVTLRWSLAPRVFWIQGPWPRPNMTQPASNNSATPCQSWPVRIGALIGAAAFLEEAVVLPLSLVVTVTKTLSDLLFLDISRGLGRLGGYRKENPSTIFFYSTN